ncbi:YdcF family protein [Panacibacter ginsenosidivorans]|uniref:YdcF family protein n=1 Tax=Panacibacter ginsenosidivorans TaxID=1813871 RepID=A0A5B8VHA2_9BACT|nr:YdcF family protein [Panacibacter ginsenosidivorans]QEC69966.1 YdcF family protein [Panacibacter ginsenosidivorans]
MQTKRNKIFTRARLMVLSLFIILSACAYSSKSTKRILQESQEAKYDIIVVPGVPFDTAEGKWSRTMKARVYWSKYLYDKGITKNVMYSGSSVYTPYYEGEIMAMYAEAIGIPKEHIYTETKAEHSTENIYYSYQKARKLGFKRIALASDPFQTKMLTQFTATKVSPDVAFLPIVFDTLKAMEPQMTDPPIDYQKAYNKDFVALTKRESFWERLQGTMGTKLDTLAYK